ncbi:MAG: hypothetical protein Kow0080_31990 [Candidatus Promineifilaceae bacterium]
MQNTNPGMTSTQSPPITPRDRLLQALLQGPLPDPQATLHQTPDWRFTFTAAYFLADTRPQTDVVSFVQHTVPLLLRQLQRTTEHQRETYVGRVRGRIDWPATTKARYQTGYNPAIYVCRHPQRLEDTPENQLLKFVLTAVDRTIMMISPVMLTAERWTAESGAEPNWLRGRAAAVSQLLRPLLGHIRLRQVTLPDAITPQHLLKARTSKTELYGRVADIYQQYHTLAIQGDWAALRPLFAHTLLLPTEATPAAHTFIQLAATGILMIND